MGRVIKAGRHQVRPIGDEEEQAAAMLALAKKELLDTAQQSRNDWKSLVTIAVERAIARHIDQEDGVLDEIYDKYLSQLEALDGAIVEVHPEDRAASGIDRRSDLGCFCVVESSDVGRGGLRIKLGRAEIDATIPGFLCRLKEALDV